MSLTKKRWTAPGLTGDWGVDGPKIIQSISSYLISLEGKGSLSISEASIYASQGIQFPAGNSSSSTDTLDAYAEAHTTPTPTSGSGAFTSVTGSVYSQQVGNRVNFDATVVITTNNTAAGFVQLTLPFTAAAITAGGGSSDNDLGLLWIANGSTLFIFKYDGTYPGGSGRTLYVSGTVRV